jgi:hypothetical protein
MPGLPSPRSAALYALVLASASAVFAQSPQYPPSRPGFPFNSVGNGGMESGHPAIAHLGLPTGVTPVRKSIVFGTVQKKLFVVNADGTVASGFPVNLPGIAKGSPAVGDLDGDGVPEIVIGFGSFNTGPRAATPGGMIAFRRNGTQLWRRDSTFFADNDGIVEAVVGSPAIGDMDNDGHPEVVWGSLDARVYVVDGRNGTDKAGFPKYVLDTIFSTPALADIDGDGRLDAVVGVDAHFDQAPNNTPEGGCLHVYRYDGTEVVGFPRCVDQVLYSSPAVGDINGDGRPEIVTGTGSYYTTPPRSRVIHAWKCNGMKPSGWPLATEGHSETSPALADLDNDGVLDVIFTENNVSPATTFRVKAYKATGATPALLWSAVPKNFFGSTLSAGDPIVADVVGDGKAEVLVTTNTEFAVFSSTGTQITDGGTHTPGQPSYFMETPAFNVAVDDFEGDGTVEVVSVNAAPFPSGTDTKVYVWNPKSGVNNYPWPTFHHDAQRTGKVGTATCPDIDVPLKFYALPPCRAVDTRGADGPRGGPAIPAQRIRTFFLAGVCGVPSDAAAVSANLTVVSPTFAGNLRAFPGEGPSPLTSIINYKAGQVKANNAVLRLGAGEVSLQNDQGTGTVHVVLDVNGYFK